MAVTGFPGGQRRPRNADPSATATKDTKMITSFTFAILFAAALAVALEGLFGNALKTLSGAISAVLQF